MKKNIATVISRIFDPFVMLAVVFVVFLYQSSVFLPALLVMVVTPLLLFILLWKKKMVGDWDVSDRRERPKVLWPFLIIEASSIVAFRLWIFVPVLVALAGFALITHVWKISGHVTAAALATGMIIAHFGWVWWPTLLIVPVVAWSRVVRRDHTVMQVIAGALYSWALIVILT